MDQDSSGKFVAGNKASPGRPRKSVEERYLKKLSASVTLADWKDICKKAVTDAKRGDARARQWISEYLLGKPLQRNEVTGKDGAGLKIEVEYVNTPYPVTGVPSGTGDNSAESK